MKRVTTKSKCLKWTPNKGNGQRCSLILSFKWRASEKPRPKQNVWNVTADLTNQTCNHTLLFVHAALCRRFELDVLFFIEWAVPWFIIQVDLYYFCCYKDAVSALMISTSGIYIISRNFGRILSNLNHWQKNRAKKRWHDPVDTGWQETHAVTLKSLFATGKIQLKQWTFSVPAVCVLMVCRLV